MVKYNPVEYKKIELFEVGKKLRQPESCALSPHCVLFYYLFIYHSFNLHVIPYSAALFSGQMALSLNTLSTAAHVLTIRTHSFITGQIRNSKKLTGIEG